MAMAGVVSGSLYRRTHSLSRLAWYWVGGRLAPFYIHQMNRVNSRNGSIMMTAPKTLSWLLLLLLLFYFFNNDLLLLLLLMTRETSKNTVKVSVLRKDVIEFCRTMLHKQIEYSKRFIL